MVGFVIARSIAEIIFNSSSQQFFFRSFFFLTYIFFSLLFLCLVKKKTCFSTSAIWFIDKVRPHFNYNWPYAYIHFHSYAICVFYILHINVWFSRINLHNWLNTYSFKLKIRFTLIMQLNVCIIDDCIWWWSLIL